ncbi:MAG: DivIVA domain-containing protein [Eubacteriales bacterium]|jgi:cell division initiation protein|nr:DivIVA domain-containing protein [Eubacteriales bacterium]MDD4104354.1 DivIVA domain-containing protein [Eubacteriales bacterium]MDD4709699.1 DivIVA domain-containing protein [Eubacteriales bacterium]NLO15200.1 DivIVA domain-containing protein [Clostridiales bacterium]
MPITVTMIEEKEFKTKVRGYDPVEVDEFLDDICDEMIAQQETILSLREKLKQQDRASFVPPAVPPVMQPAPLAPAPSINALPADVESAQKLLAKTQKACDETIAEAKKRAEEILQEAQDRVPDPEITDLEAQREDIRKEIEILQAEAEAFRKRFKSLLNDQNEILEAELG